ncbi:MAG: copper homeostasis protein CutC [Acidothermus sp.]|nr:copper homeostasis protein CutC [Acidothermus sp.]MCL6538253.1 copper homeostasis protein CutC [Acidothermus sp.]
MDALLEVVALDVADALAAVQGGADRLEIVRDMASDGLTPALETVAAIRDAVDVPLRVMLRSTPTFTVDAAGLDELCAAADRFRAIGVEECVLGFLTPEGTVDLASVRILLEAARPARWTFHRAFDHARDPAAAWAVVTGIAGLDAVLSAGSAAGLSIEGLRSHLCLPDAGSFLVVGGGLRADHIPALRALGLRRFHVGSRVRHGSRWDHPVDPDAVRRWRRSIDEQAPLVG